MGWVWAMEAVLLGQVVLMTIMVQDRMLEPLVYGGMTALLMRIFGDPIRVLLHPYLVLFKWSRGECESREVMERLVSQGVGGCLGAVSSLALWRHHPSTSITSPWPWYVDLSAEVNAAILLLLTSLETDECPYHTGAMLTLLSACRQGSINPAIDIPMAMVWGSMTDVAVSMLRAAAGIAGVLYVGRTLGPPVIDSWDDRSSTTTSLSWHMSEQASEDDELNDADDGPTSAM